VSDLPPLEVGAKSILSLDRINLQDEQFDYVRICCIGLGVPEDEASPMCPLNSFFR
jgi:hypothetical protein